MKDLKKIEIEEKERFEQIWNKIKRKDKEIIRNKRKKIKFCSQIK